MKQLSQMIAKMSQSDILDFEKDGQFAFDINGQQVVINADDAEVISEDIPGWLVSNYGRLTVALDITVTDELKREGIAREIVNRIQNIRKSHKFEITDRIVVRISSNKATDEAICEFNGYISKQVLAKSIEVDGNMDAENAETVTLDDATLLVEVKKA